MFILTTKPPVQLHTCNLHSTLIIAQSEGIAILFEAPFTLLKNMV